ncbi:2-oxo acid dehydrogenase subunit E2 [Glaciibacter flavus]|uniref:Dihydrolipoamide acetyltransferase component of pyruvate dehydrogenase complex n=1 Tax=Orlajensenia flava TaxID=2565934 RepID=A0A4S4FYG0_9MICO|nr:dihydrolipoamide acetyltransferase family protein [Glaciibacter flavus]THG35212.1 2-oxo acid dehydrogenase subunit E2 [Glaciibacter flavus]
MSREFLLPDLGEGLTEAEIVRWLVAPGDAVAVDQPVIEVESAKSVVELPCPFAGIVETLHGETGSIVHAGQPLLSVAEKAADADAAASVPAEPGVVVPDVSVDGSGAVLIGYGTKPVAMPVARAAGSRFGSRSGVRPATRTTTALLDPDRRSPVVSPLVRRLARDNGFDASQLSGSGPDALVRRSDVEDFIRTRDERPADAPPTMVDASPTADLDTTAADLSGAAGGTSSSGDTRIPITGLRRAVSERLSRSRREIPEATVWMDVDATALFAAKRELEAATGERFTLTALLARFTVAGLKRFPVLNASVDTERGEIVQHADIHLGLAAQTPRGLMVPVIHDAGEMTTRALRDAVTTLVGADGAFAPGALTGGTFTLNNFGSLGVDGSAAIINHPEVAILGVGRMMDRPWVVDGQLAVRTVVELSFVFDHRVCDGGIAAGFLTYIAGCIEHPIALLGDL